MKKYLKLLFVFGILLSSLLVQKVYAAEKHTITFVTGTDDIVMEPFEVEDGDTINDKGINFSPKREGYAYPEWYTDSNFKNEFDYEAKIYKDTTLYAKWIIGIEEIRITSDLTSLTDGEVLPEFSYTNTTKHISIGNVSWYSDEDVKVGDIVDQNKEYSIYMSAKADDGYTLDGAIVYFNGTKVDEWIAWPLSMGGTEIGGTFFIPIKVNPSLKIIKATDTYTIDESSKAEFEIDADYSLFKQGGEVYIDGDTNPLDHSNYTSREGSTIITLNNNYVDTLSEGKHTIKIVFNNNKAATTSFKVVKNTKNKTTTNNNKKNEITPPQTGDNQIDNAIFYMSILALSILGVGGIILVKRKK